MRTRGRDPRRRTKLRLHTRAQNSAGQRVRIVLNLKGVPYEYVAIPSLSSEAYRALNPQGLMPALEDRRTCRRAVDGDYRTHRGALFRAQCPAGRSDPARRGPVVRAADHRRSLSDQQSAGAPLPRRGDRGGPKAVSRLVSPLDGENLRQPRGHAGPADGRVTLLLRGPAWACRGLPRAAGRQRPPVRLRPVALSRCSWPSTPNAGGTRRSPGPRPPCNRTTALRRSAALQSCAFAEPPCRNPCPA